MDIKPYNPNIDQSKIETGYALVARNNQVVEFLSDSELLHYQNNNPTYTLFGEYTLLVAAGWKKVPAIYVHYLNKEVYTPYDHIMHPANEDGKLLLECAMLLLSIGILIAIASIYIPSVSALITHISSALNTIIQSTNY